jgi:hypothetical protein
MRRTHGSEGAGAQQCAPATQLGEDDVRRRDPHPRYLVKLVHRLGERADQLLDPGLDRGDVGAGLIDPRQHGAQQKRVMVGEVPDERLLQHTDLGAHPGPGQLGQHPGIAFTGEQRGQHRPPGHPEHIRHDRGQLDLGVLEQLLHPLLLRGPRGDQIQPITGQVAQPADLHRRHETRTQHLPLGNLAQPHRIELVGLGPARQVLHVLGVHQPRIQSLGLQQVEHRFPVIRRGFHHHPGHTQLPKPIGQPQQRSGHRRERGDLLRPPTGPGRARHPHTDHNLCLADVQRRNPLDDLLAVLGVLQHHRSSCPMPATRRPPAGAARQTANLVRVLEATLKGPQRSSQRPTNPRPHTDQGATASAGDQHRFSARNGPPDRGNRD